MAWESLGEDTDSRSLGSRISQPCPFTPTVSRNTEHNLHLAQIRQYEFTCKVCFIFVEDFESIFRARNICVRVELRNENNTVTALIDRNGNMVKAGQTSVSYHRSSPLFLDEMKFVIPDCLTPDHHLYFTFCHVSVKEGTENTIGYSWLPLLDANQQIISGRFPGQNFPVGR